MTGEYAKNFGQGDRPWSFYVEPDLDVHNQSVILYIFGDYLANPVNLTGTGPATFLDGVEKWQYGGGVNWLPTSFTRLRAGVTYNQYVGPNALSSGQTRDYLSFDVSGGVAF